MTFQWNPGQLKAREGILQRDEVRFGLFYGGSRSGKSALLTATTQDRAMAAPGSRHLIVRKEGTAVRVAIQKDTFPKMWSLRYPELTPPKWYEKDGVYVFSNEAEIWLGGLNDDKQVEKMLGREYATIQGEEISEWPHAWFTLLRSRLAQVVDRVLEIENTGEIVNYGPQPQKFFGSLNPTTRMHWTYRRWIEGMDPEDDMPIRDLSQYAYQVLNPYENQDNLSADYLADLESLSERARKRFLLGEYVSDDDNALWRREFFKRSRLKEDGRYPVDMRRIVIAIDPAVSTEPGSDETGIVAIGQGSDGNGYVLADESGRYRPEEWARRAISLYRSLDADRIVAEVNNGGDMVEATIRAQATDVPYKGVRATRGKAKRAEPVAALYERGKILHIGEFTALEDQMCSVTVDFDSKVAGWSPDRVDALVWGVTELFPSLSAKKKTQALPRPKISMV